MERRQCETPRRAGHRGTAPSAQAPITSWPRARISRISGSRKCRNEKSTLVISKIFMVAAYTGCDARRSSPLRAGYPGHAGADIVPETGSARRTNPPIGEACMLASWWRGIVAGCGAARIRRQLRSMRANQLPRCRQAGADYDPDQFLPMVGRVSIGRRALSAADRQQSESRRDAVSRDAGKGAQCRARHRKSG